jgi:hypothetical protein
LIVFNDIYSPFLVVQDVGAVALIRRVAPNLPIHGSTQMSITSAEGAEFASGLSCGAMTRPSPGGATAKAALPVRLPAPSQPANLHSQQ